MKTEILKEIIKRNSLKEDFAVLTNLSTGNSEIFDSKNLLGKEFKNYENKIKNFYNLKKYISLLKIKAHGVLVLHAGES